jgi:acyl-CoA thioester hydrolase
MQDPMSRHPPGKRADYRWFHAITTRWMDNDVFQHVNNVNYFSFFDTAVTYYEMTEKVVDLYTGPVHCVVVEVQCRYHRSVAFPDVISVGLRVARVGGSSVRYEIGIFRNHENEAAAEGHFVHVFVGRATQRPVPVPDASRAILNRISVPA